MPGPFSRVATPRPRYSAVVDVFMRTATRDLLADHVADGALRPDLDPEVAFGLIYAMLNGRYLGWLQNETTLESVVRVVADYLDLILRFDNDGPKESQ